MALNGISLTALWTKHTPKLFPKTTCNEKNKTMEYKLQRKARLFLFWLSDLEDLTTVLLSLSQTITNCSDRIEPGYYHPENTFVYYFGTKQGGNNMSLLLEQLFGDKQVRRHQNVAALTSAPSSRTLLVHEYNIYQSKVVTVAVWEKSKPFYMKKYLFTLFPMQVCLRTKGYFLISLPKFEVRISCLFQNFTLKVTCIPWSIHVDADVDTSSRNPRKFYKNHRGVEVLMIEEICKVRN